MSLAISTSNASIPSSSPFVHDTRLAAPFDHWLELVGSVIIKYAVESYYLPLKAETSPKLTIYLRYNAGENRYSMERIWPHRLF